MINIVFIILYVTASLVGSGIDLYVLLSFHYGILAFNHIKEKSIVITPQLIYYAGVIIVNLGNISLISAIGTPEQLKIYNYIIPRYIDTAALIWCISNAFFIIGYDYFKDKSFPTVAFELKNPTVLRTIFYFLIIENVLSIIGSGITLRQNQVGKIYVLLNTIGILFFARLWAKNDNKTYRTYALILYAIETYLSLVTSYLRFELILPTFYLFVGYFIGKGHIKYIFSYRIIPFLVIMLLFSSVFSTLQSNRANFLGVFTHLSSAKVAVEEEKPEDKKKGGLLVRSSNVAQITNVIKLTKQNGFYEGRASSPILIALIPRALWPDKPLIQLGNWFALEIGVASKSEFGISNNSINMTVPGELYLDFGWIGVILGSMLLGAFISALWNATAFYASEYNLSGIIMGGYVIMLSIGSYADLQIVVTLLSTYLIFLVIKILALKL